MTEIRGPTSAFQIPTEQSVTPNARTPAFGSVLDQAVQAQRVQTPSNVRFSRHAADRIARRGIQITPAELNRLDSAISQIEARGGKESIVVSGSLVYVVNVPSRTVVTALSGPGEQGNVFTNIDSAAVL